MYKRQIFEEREEISVQDDEALQLQSIYEIGTSAGGQHPNCLLYTSNGGSDDTYVTARVYNFGLTVKF